PQGSTPRPEGTLGASNRLPPLNQTWCCRKYTTAPFRTVSPARASLRVGGGRPRRTTTRRCAGIHGAASTRLPSTRRPALLREPELDLRRRACIGVAAAKTYSPVQTTSRASAPPRQRRRIAPGGPQETNAPRQIRIRG